MQPYSAIEKVALAWVQLARGDCCEGCHEHWARCAVDARFSSQILLIVSRNMARISSELDMMQSGGEDMKLRTDPVCRNLFGPVDHQQLQQDFQRLLHMSVEEATRRWNFDFQRDQPAPGATEWEELQCRDVPSFYHSCMVKSGRRCGESSPPVGEYLEIIAREMYRSCKSEKRLSVPSTVKRRQATIPDFFAVKKRRLLHPKGPTLP
ncbi:cyclin-dependent kinase inhibitor 1-like isoform X1 [Arapaima gigas]